MGITVRVTIDRGGTFCDIWAQVSDGRETIFKLLSVDPSNYDDALTEGVRRVIEFATGTAVKKGELLDGSIFEWIRIGTTVATNALLERKGERFALLTTSGFKDVCIIGTQKRPNIFDLNIRKPGVLYDKVVEVAERVTVEDYVLNPYPSQHDFNDTSLIKTESGEVVRIIEKLDVAKTLNELQTLKAEGYNSLAVCLLHSYIFADHERKIAELAKEVGFEFVSVSSDLSKQIKFLNRSNSACADAYLQSTVRNFVEGFSNNFSTQPQRLEFMQSDGGLVTGSKFCGLRAILSGPAGGVVAIARTCYDKDEGTAIIGFDMGGTSTDVSRFDRSFEHVFDTEISGTTITAPMLDVRTIAAGGGSILQWKNNMFVVGPESAGAHPGPACYRKGGPLTITDANLFLGRLIPETFPAIFGPGANEPLDTVIVQKKFEDLTAQINSDIEIKLTPEEVASGFIRMADETMSRPIRNITEARGFATQAHNLASFGGAGGQHACAIARNLGIQRIIIHKYSSILSAYGIGLASVVSEQSDAVAYTFSPETLPATLARLEDLRKKATEDLVSQGINPELIEFENYASLRYEGSDTNISVLQPEDNDFVKVFVEQHRREFAFELANRPVVVDTVRVRGIGNTNASDKKPSIFAELSKIVSEPIQAKATKTHKTYLEGVWMDIPCLDLKELDAGTRISGPALILDETQTILVESGATVSILTSHIVIDRAESEQTMQEDYKSCNPVQLSMFSNRFMSIAEQMGHTLQRTAISTSIKERLDFSCALFSPNGKLVANAPQTGGTHLPDITVVTPVFFENEIIFYVASRGHHTDIGGIGITSMVPDSKELWHEGIAIKTMKLVSNGTFEEEAIRKVFADVANKPGCSATRRINDNISDLKAQIAANQRGIKLLQELCSLFGLRQVQFYMHGIQQNAELAIREFLKKTYEKRNGVPLKGIDYYDDGTPVVVEITIDPKTGSAVFDFEGTGEEIYGNMNSPVSITSSAIMYALRCMIDSEIPMNEGCLTPVKIKIPKGSILNPSAFVAISGSTIASQRVTDLILRAFEACGASQGCANSVGWGIGGKDPLTGVVTPGWNYGESIGGGSGAGPNWHGTSGVHVHSTNTRITDVEVIEKRTPVLVRQFSLRPHSGGDGLFKGGDGIIRIIEARIPMKFSIVSTRRTFAPYGMAGGKRGGVGKNLWIKRKEGEDAESGNSEFGRIGLGGMAVLSVGAGDRVEIHTPGGGGWGKPSDN
ncbi:putative hydantoinase b oxoprolinase protein [Coleophoma crateriformis]|uniref:Putative hydantoinase b oxoprolinase protein n=1 Tax=Coleophoma crateriformis TaxID=565419 RepID=A0A3D8QR05_9HELO|nr:putative hydantoinase b oxoprolinase protein [Coleophoma crateriformis]